MCILLSKHLVRWNWNDSTFTLQETTWGNWCYWSDYNHQPSRRKATSKWKQQHTGLVFQELLFVNERLYLGSSLIYSVIALFCVLGTLSVLLIQRGFKMWINHCDIITVLLQKLFYLKCITFGYFSVKFLFPCYECDILD